MEVGVIDGKIEIVAFLLPLGVCKRKCFRGEGRIVFIKITHSAKLQRLLLHEVFHIKDEAFIGKALLKLMRLILFWFLYCRQNFFKLPAGYFGNVVDIHSD